MDKNTLIPEHVRALTPYVPGKLISEVMESLGLKTAIKLGSNENNLGPSPKALAAMAEELKNLSRYGDVGSVKLRKAIAGKLSLPEECVICSNGSSELILVLAHTILSPGLSAVMSKPSFTLYAKNVLAAGAQASETPLLNYEHDLMAILYKITKKTRLIFLDNPLNPTGAYLTPDRINSFVNDLPPGVLLVLDEAYVDFARAPRPDYAKLLETEKVMIMRTFSKLYGLAGVRVGYALAPPFVLEALNKVRQPFNLNNLAQAGALAALYDDEHIQNTLKMTWDGLNFFQENFPKIGIKTFRTESNFMMLEPVGFKSTFFVDLLLRKGIILRSLESFGLDDKVRATAGLPEENLKFLEAAKEALSDLKTNG
jgi:histidinol-phosphate aminotransferase